MRFLIAAILYTALVLPANADMSAVEAMREGDMRKLRFHETAQSVTTETFDHQDGGPGSLADYNGKITLVNFWATWCAPCRKEMPHLRDLQAEFGGDDFEVVTIATGRNDLMGMKAFFDDIGVDNLPLHKDPRSAVARDMAVLGLPVTVVLDRDGREIARLQGDADWYSDNARDIIRALIDMSDR